MTASEILTQWPDAVARNDLFVLDGGRLAGVLSLRDLLALELDEKEEEVTLLNAYVHYVPADLSPKPRS